MFNRSNLFNPKFALALFANLVLLASCGGDAPKPTDEPAKPAAQAPTSQSATTSVPAQAAEPAKPTEAPAAAAPSGDPKEAVVAALKKQLKSGPYRNKTTIVSDNTTTELTAEVIPPDRMHITNNIGEQVMESIYIGDKGWTKIGDVWSASPIAGGQILAQMTDSFVDELAGTLGDVTFVGPGDVDGLPVWVYSYTSDMNKATTMKMDSKSVAKMWIGVADGLIHKQEIDGEAMGVKSKTTQVVTYDAAIKIEAPVK